jgi:hypothetical protein
VHSIKSLSKSQKVVMDINNLILKFVKRGKGLGINISILKRAEDCHY